MINFNQKMNKNIYRPNIPQTTNNSQPQQQGFFFKTKKDAYKQTNMSTNSQNITQFEKNLFQDKKTNSINNHAHYKQPITSIGIIGVIYNEMINDYEFLMIRRKDTLGYVDFMRGKYQLFNKQYIMNILSETTLQERENLKKDFDYNWSELWGDLNLKQRYLNEENVSRDKFNALKDGVHSLKIEYNLESCLREVQTRWEEPEWGFPKGRREHKEKEVTTAIREFCEETGINEADINIINNIQPYEEIFNGSNFKSYKHKYYVALIKSPLTLNNFQKSEVSAIEWKTYPEAIHCLRDYDNEKKDILYHLYHVLHNFDIH